MDAGLVRDEIKEGYVSTFGIKHDELPVDANRLVTDFFFTLVGLYLSGHVSVVIEAAFQHKVWEPRIPAILELARACMLLCSAEDAITSSRPLQRGVENPDREFYHGDHRAAHYRKTGQIIAPGSYDKPDLDLPTIEVSTDDGYVPSLDDIVKRVKSSVA